MRQFAKRLLLPPAFPFLIMFAGWLGKLSGLDSHNAVFLAGLGLLYLCSTPFVGHNLLALLPRLVPDPDEPAEGQPEAIIVLSGDLKQAPDAVSSDLGDLSVERIRRAVRLHGETGLPILVSGRAATIMASVLSDEFGVEATWIETRSRRTAENAACSAETLRAAGIGAAYVVTQDWHMPRAIRAFRSTGLSPWPAPASVSRPGRLSAAGLIPSSAGGAACYFAMHELLGLLHQRVSNKS